MASFIIYLIHEMICGHMQITATHVLIADCQYHHYVTIQIQIRGQFLLNWRWEAATVTKPDIRALMWTDENADMAKAAANLSLERQAQMRWVAMKGLTQLYDQKWSVQ